MPRTSKKAPKKCSSHEFSLKPCTERLRRPQNLSLSYCVKGGEQRSSSAGKNVGCLQAPIYNYDSSYASPAFILPSDNVFLADSGLLSHEKRCNH